MRVPNWNILAAFLLDDKDGTATAIIGKSKNYNVDDCCVEMIYKYLKSGDLSWKHVLKSLRDATYSNLATELEEELGMFTEL